MIFAGANRLVTADRNQQKVLDATTGTVLREFDHGSQAEVLAASADGRWLASMEHHNYAIDRYLEKDVVHVWDLNTGTLLHTLPARPQSWYMRMQFSPDGKALFTGIYHERTPMSAAKWDMKSGKLFWISEGIAALTLEVSPDGSILATGAPPGKFELCDAKTGRAISAEQAKYSRAASVWLSHTGKQITTVGYNSITTWDGTNGRRLQSFDVPYNGSINDSPVQSPNGRFAVTFQKGIIVWDVAAQKKHSFQPPADAGSTFAFSPDSSLLATCSGQEKKTVRIWDLNKGQEVTNFHDEKAGWPGTLFFPGDAKTLYIVGHHVVGYDIATGKEFCCWRAPLANDFARLAKPAEAPQMNRACVAGVN